MREKLLKIINNYGVMPQLKYFQSEVFELGEAIINYENDEFNYYDEVDSSNKKHIAEEIADVIVMLKQFQHYYEIEDEAIKEVMKYKVERQLDRIKNEDRSKNN